MLLYNCNVNDGKCTVYIYIMSSDPSKSPPGDAQASDYNVSETNSLCIHSFKNSTIESQHVHTQASCPQRLRHRATRLPSPAIRANLRTVLASYSTLLVPRPHCTAHTPQEICTRTHMVMVENNKCTHQGGRLTCLTKLP